ncbi:Molybdopterin-synthase adenylyltransferase [Novipirellula aureliae]|uniref:Molybdopterin-synthase adenylyltransferase n=1 Tax=Novipirellula aureliae TaxID=2527966 RepID=A0A5C6EDD8_9BACT|nr:ThiF family adenylyltransferase [Novipirellula aureliae]TWU45997.1 Molybdopterin-synthase adenylyltransferase [Novipirellula aureliae]
MNEIDAHNLSDNRYARQVRFDAIGVDGQRLISQSTVAILGCGALGSVIAEILARSGVGQLRIIDRDYVEWTNLQRQALFDENDAKQGRAKSEAACDRLQSINSDITAEPFVADLTADNIDRHLRGTDLVVDAADNFSIRFLLNDWSLKTKTAWVHGGCVGAAGQVRLFSGLGAPCFRCLVPNLPPASSVATCDTAGVVGAATHAIASLQALEALKWLSGNRDTIHESVWSFDFWSNRFRELSIDSSLSQSCRACGERQYDFLEGDPVGVGETMTLCGRSAVQITPSAMATVDLNQMALRWQGQGEVQLTRFFVRLTLATLRLTLFRDGRAVIEGTDQSGEARAVYDRLVGS